MLTSGYRDWSATLAMGKPMSESFSRGFDRGNYGNAYESQDWESWYANNCDRFTDVDGSIGMLLGFFSLYELHEIPEDLQETIAALRQQCGEDL